jgi:NDP-sugar pyrophosphorylase family protein
MVIAYLKGNDNFRMRIELSWEDVLLDTGGGLKKAAWFFKESSVNGEEAFLLHNVDVLSSIDVAAMLRSHMESQSLVTIAVQKRQSSRQLLFNERGILCGRIAGRERDEEIVLPSRQVEPLAFCGLHVISPRLFALMSEDGAFSIIDTYLRLASQGEKISAFRADKYYWRDLGKLESVRMAAKDLTESVLFR